MFQPQSWTNNDFETLSWHDVNVYGFRLEAFNEDQGTADLIFDIDFILEWHQHENPIQFTVCSAVLKFHDVFGLKMRLDYAQPTIGMCPFGIFSIERREVKFTKTYQWCIPMNWPGGQIEFQATGFTQIQTGSPRKSTSQMLEPKDRF